MKKFLLNKINLNLFVIVILIINIIPLNLSRTSHFTYNFEFFISLVSIALIIGCVLSILSSFIIIITKRFGAFSTYSSFISFILLWVFLTGIFFPVTGEHDPFFNLSLSINKKYLIILKFILIVFFYFLIKRIDKKNFFFRFIYFFALSNFIYLSLNIQSDRNKIFINNLNEFGKKNLIVISFDGISGHKMYNEIVQNKNFNKNLKDFKFYKNTFSGAPLTYPSMNLELNGKYKEDTSEEYYKNILNNKNLDISVYGTYREFVVNKKRVVPKGELQNYDMSSQINKFLQSYGWSSIGRWGTPLTVFVVEYLFYSKLYENFLTLITKNDSKKPNPFKHIKSVEKIDLYEYDKIFNNIVFNDELNDVVRMYHFSFSHWPVLVNENCKELSPFDKNIPSYKQEERVVKCISKKINNVIQNLKKKNLYNSSMIIFKSDHGKPNYVERNYSQNILDVFKSKKYNKHYEQYPYNQKINNSFYWGFGRYSSFILIKDQDQVKKEIEISNKQVFLHDLSITYCSFFFNFDKCSYLERNNLILKEHQFSSNYYDIYIPKNINSFTHMEHLNSYQISNSLPFLKSLKLNNIVLND